MARSAKSRQVAQIRQQAKEKNKRRRSVLAGFRQQAANAGSEAVIADRFWENDYRMGTLQRQGVPDNRIVQVTRQAGKTKYRVTASRRRKAGVGLKGRALGRSSG